MTRNGKSPLIFDSSAGLLTGKVCFTLRRMKFLVVMLPSGSVIPPVEVGLIGLESPSRVKSIKQHLERFPRTFPFARQIKDYGMEPILAVHDAEYVNYLQTIFDEW